MKTNKTVITVAALIAAMVGSSIVAGHGQGYMSAAGYSMTPGQVVVEEVEVPMSEVTGNGRRAHRRSKSHSQSSSHSKHTKKASGCSSCKSSCSTGACSTKKSSCCK